jgi:hypothetical protein
MPRINWIEVQGFRAFGKKPQRVDFSSTISVLWGPNSHGKTSFAEAVEFLFTGTIVRKELLASGQDEFADSLRNTHLPQSQAVFVAAEVLDSSGSSHSIRRTLTSDFGRKTSCTSTLEIDGKPATADGLARIGILFSQPPMAVPILMQHTLSYLFTARPSERSLYFKALLEVGDLDVLRSTISQRVITLQKADTTFIEKLRKATTIDDQDVQNCLAPLLELDNAPPDVTSAIADALGLLINSAGYDAPADTPEKTGFVSGLLLQKQARTFPLAQFSRGMFISTTTEEEDLWTSLTNFGEQSQRVDDQVKQLTNLFTEVLKVPAVAAGASATDCPVCGTEDALTLERVQVIRDQLEATQAFSHAQERARNSLLQLGVKVAALERAARVACPNFRVLPRRQRREIGFSAERMSALLPEENQNSIKSWLRELRLFLRAMNRLSRISSAIKETAKRDLSRFADAQAARGLRELLSELGIQQGRLVERERAYVQAEHPLKEALRSVVDSRSNTTGWQELIDVANDQEALYSDLIDMKARAVVINEFSQALQKIDRAKEEVMNEKFAEMSQEIEDWWERLRPDEPVFFSGVKPRPQTVRTIDFKASLATTSERLNPQVRDVIAVFSVSQMHCLGLAAFLARAVRERCGFVVLDDPILSSDEDHCTNFKNECLGALIDANFQVILLTQDQNLQKALGHLYNHYDIGLFDITTTTPADGCEVNKTSDSISAMLARVAPYTGNARLEQRKFACEKLRNVAERVCKEIIVKNLRQNGDATADITDYTGIKGTLESLIKEVDPFLVDMGHPGQLRTIAQTLNPGNHDDKVPTPQALKHACGDLRHFRKEYNLS